MPKLSAVVYGEGCERKALSMLTLKPSCECCDGDLPPEARDARICTFEGTFCASCAETRFGGICPNCSGELLRRLVRPAAALARFPAANERFLKAHPECADLHTEAV